ncbi:MAG: hypothetical protein P1U57_00790 [Oleibacter sp.]|nr:hypothetical protein [Thalassolituus sp.]
MNISIVVKLLLLSIAIISLQVNARVNLFFDDFERTSLGSDWTVVKGESRSEAGIGTYIANSGTRSMYTCCRYVEVISRTIDLTGVNYAELTFWLRSGSDDYSEWPSSGDDLYVDILLSDNTWQEVKFYEGGGSTSGDEYFYRAKIPTSAYHANFKFRFRQIDGSGTSIKRDFWHIDDVAVVDHEVGSVQYPLFYDGFERDILVSTMDWVVTPVDARFNSEISNHASVSGSKSMYSCCGEMITSTRDIDLSGLSFAEMEFWVKNGDDSLSGTDFYASGNYNSETPSSGDDIRVEIYLNDGQWHEIDYYLGTTTTPGKERWYRASVPDEGLHSEFKIRFYQIDGSLSSSKRYDLWHIDEVLVATRDAPPKLDHFRLSYASTGLTCNPTDVLINACANADCSELFTESVTIDLSPSGWVGGDTITFTDGTITASFAQRTVGSTSVGIASSSPAIVGIENLCSIDGGGYSSNCSLTFADSGFAFDVSDFIASKGLQGVNVRAVRKDTETQQCVPAFASVDKTLSLWSTYITPNDSGRVVSLPVTVNTVAVGTNSGSATSQSFSFDANGESTMDVNYTDAGLVQLNMRYSGSVSDGDEGLVMLGSDQFISRPAGMCVSSAGYCAAGDATCSVFKKAGEDFDLDVTAVGWQSDGDSNLCDNPITPSFAVANNVLSATILVPSPANSPGSISVTSYDHLASVNAKQAVTLSESEVGVFQFNVTPANYLGYDLGTFNSGPVGRFIPAYFSASVTEEGALAATCDAIFAYSGEALPWLISPEFSIVAKNVAGDTTQNYTQGDFLKLTAAGIGITAPSADNTQTGKDTNPLPVSAVLNEGNLAVNGLMPSQLDYEMNMADTLTYDRSLNSEVASFTPALTYVVSAITDSDNVNLDTPVNINPLTGFGLRFGRLYLDDNYGPEDADLDMYISAQYFNGARYVRHNDDACTSWDSGLGAVTPLTLTQLRSSSGTFMSGAGTLTLIAPTNVAGTPDTGEAELTYAVPSYLTGDYDGDGNFEDPSATARFGVYRGHDRVIYKREIRR